MDTKEGKSGDDSNMEIRQIYVEFMTKVTEYEQLVTAGLNFLSGFQQCLGQIQRSPRSEKSELVTSIIQGNENERLKSYIEAGWAKMHCKVRYICQMETCFEGLQDYLSKAEQLMCEIGCLMDSASCALRMLCKSSTDVSECEEDESMNSLGGDATEYASFMAVIYGMLKQDYVMQEKIVSSLNLRTSSEELDSYCLMWSLRPYVNDEVINQALRYLP